MEEKLIYSNIIDVSKESGIDNNHFFIRVVMRTYTKPKNWFRKIEEKIVKFDIEYNNPNIPSYEDSICWNIFSKNHQNKKNENIYNIQHAVNSVIFNELWNVKNMCITYKEENNIIGEIREYRNGEWVRH